MSGFLRATVPMLDQKVFNIGKNQSTPPPVPPQTQAQQYQAKKQRKQNLPSHIQTQLLARHRTHQGNKHQTKRNELTIQQIREQCHRGKPNTS